VRLAALACVACSTTHPIIVAPAPPPPPPAPSPRFTIDIDDHRIAIDGTPLVSPLTVEALEAMIGPVVVWRQRGITAMAELGFVTDIYVWRDTFEGTIRLDGAPADRNIVVSHHRCLGMNEVMDGSVTDALLLLVNFGRASLEPVRCDDD
jgi:hypothetical protein